MSEEQQQQRAVATLDAPGAGRIMEIARRGEVERIVREVTVPEQYQYSRRGQGGEMMIGLTSDGYLYLNRVAGVQIFQPEWVHDERGNRVRNPIHRKDYIYLRVGGVWWNDIGQMTYYSEDIEVDYFVAYQEARANGRSAKVLLARDGNGAKMWNDDGTPMLRIDVNDEDELKAYQRLLQLRSKGLLYAQTVGAVRILKAALGIKRLPTRAIRPVTIRVVGYKDSLTPEERLDKAQQDAAAIWGSAIRVGEAETLRDDELEQIGGDIDDTDAAERILEGEATEITHAQPAEPATWSQSAPAIAARAVGNGDEPPLPPEPVQARRTPADAMRDIAGQPGAESLRLGVGGPDLLEDLDSELERARERREAEEAATVRRPARR